MSLRIYGIMLALTIIILALALSPAIQSSVESTMNQTVGDTIGMNCTSTTDNFVKAGCTVVDFSIFYFIGGLILLAGAVVVARIVF